MCLREASLKTVVWFQLFQKRWNYGGRERVVVTGVGDEEGMERQNKTFRARDELLRVMLQGGCMYHRIRQNLQVVFRAPGKDVSMCQGRSFVNGTFLSWGGLLGG